MEVNSRDPLFGVITKCHQSPVLLGQSVPTLALALWRSTDSVAA
jgi:hypothetical protein